MAGEGYGFRVEGGGVTPGVSKHSDVASSTASRMKLLTDCRFTCAASTARRRSTGDNLTVRTIAGASARRRGIEKSTATHHCAASANQGGLNGLVFDGTTSRV